MARSETNHAYVRRIRDRASEMRSFWLSRNSFFKDQYNVLSLVDENKVAGLESFTSNDPRTIYNMALFLLCPDQITYNIPINNANETVQNTITQLEALVTQKWKAIDKASFKSGHQSWQRHLTGLLLTTGWYCVLAFIDGNEFVADIWNPAEVYPEFDEGLSEVSRILSYSPSRIRKMKAMNNWDIKLNLNSNLPVEVTDYWCYDDDGYPENTIIVNNELAKRKSYPNLPCIPVYCSPVSGLPDYGKIDTNQDLWKKHIGEGINVTNMDVMRSYNRLLTFLLQTAKDNALAPIIEKTDGNGVVNENDIGKRAIVYKIGKEDDISTLAMGGIPPEIPIQLQNMRTMIQRGGFADGLFTGVDGSGYLQSLVSASSQQVLKPYNQGINHLISDICNAWLYQIKRNEVQLPSTIDITQLDDSFAFEIEVEVAIPGDLIQRATTARQLSPDFKLSNTTTMDLLFPEIRDPNGEIVLARKDKALNSEVMAQLDLAAALLDQADAVELDGNQRQADIYRSFADNLQKQLMGPQQQTPTIGAHGIGNAGRQ